MKKLAVCLLLAFPILGNAQSPGNVTGNWKVTSSIAGNESTAECSFTQNGASLTGSCKSEQGTVKITGKVDGTDVSWSYASDYNGTPLTISYKGKLADGRISGESTVDPFGVSGQFTAVLEK